MQLEDFGKADSFFRKFVFWLLVAAALVFGFAELNTPLKQANSVWGEVVSSAGAPTGYRQLAATTVANVRLDNGRSINVTVPTATPGKRLEFYVYKTRFTRHETYRVAP
ncbi:MAG: hypothetical protein AAGA91_17445 [Pseudomonadota bacterium]